MKISTKYIVLRDRKTGNYLEGIKNHLHSIATCSSFVSDIKDALVMSYDAYLEQKEKIKSLAKINECEIVVVSAELNLTYPNGSDVPKIERKSEKPDLFDLLRKL